ncbi:MAG TPA: sensor histidine kinase [Xanthobacteraceae bacterium]|jgi:two-component sensor histidine kinase
MPWRASSLRQRLSTFGLLIVCPLLIAGSAVSIFYVLVEQQASQNDALATVRNAASVIDHEINKDMLALQILSTSLATNEGGVERAYREAKQVTDAIPGSVVELRRPNGETVFNTAFPLGTALDKRTNEILAIAEREAKTKRSSYVISDVFVSSRIPKTYIAIVQPVISENQGVMYLLNFEIPSDVFSNILRSQLREPEWLIGVTGKDGRILARNWDSERYVGQRASDIFLQHTQGDEGIFRATTLDGIHVFNVYARSKLTGWRVGAGIPMNIFDAPFYRSLFALAGIAFVALCCSFGLSYAYAGGMLKPADELRKLVSAGSHERRPPSTTGLREFDDVLALLAKCLADLDDRDRHKQTLVNELNHRAKNTLTTIQAIAYQTHRQSKSWEEFRKHFEHRLSAMARSFDLLTKNEWRSSDLREVVLECCKPFCESHRIQLSGPPVPLPPTAVIGMGMVVHELATNATKYGAFSNAVGWADVKWELQKSGTSVVVYFQWKEHDGPSVAQTGPKGFGSYLIASTITAELHGKAETRLEPDGLDFSASFPVNLQ